MAHFTRLQDCRQLFLAGVEFRERIGLVQDVLTEGIGRLGFGIQSGHRFGFLPSVAVNENACDWIRREGLYPFEAVLW
ncbi:MAG: hypothetical protein ACU841_11485 [Gammaproteobacteria bacterium]